MPGTHAPRFGCSGATLHRACSASVVSVAESVWLPPPRHCTIGAGQRLASVSSTVGAAVLARATESPLGTVWDCAYLVRHWWHHPGLCRMNEGWSLTALFYSCEEETRLGLNNPSAWRLGVAIVSGRRAVLTFGGLPRMDPILALCTILANSGSLLCSLVPIPSLHWRYDLEPHPTRKNDEEH